MNNFEITRCENCKAELPLRPDAATMVEQGGIVKDTDGDVWAYFCNVCVCDYEPLTSQPLPTWRTIAPPLVEEIERLRRLLKLSVGHLEYANKMSSRLRLSRTLDLDEFSRSQRNEQRRINLLQEIESEFGPEDS